MTTRADMKNTHFISQRTDHNQHMQDHQLQGNSARNVEASFAYHTYGIDFQHQMICTYYSLTRQLQTQVCHNYALISAFAASQPHDASTNQYNHDYATRTYSDLTQICSPPMSTSSPAKTHI